MLTYEIANPDVGKFVWTPPKSLQEVILAMEIEDQRKVESTVTKHLQAQTHLLAGALLAGDKADLILGIMADSIADLADRSLAILKSS